MLDEMIAVARQHGAHAGLAVDALFQPPRDRERHVLLVVPRLPIEPGSTPPCPASIATIMSRPCASSADFTTTGGALDAIGD